MEHRTQFDVASGNNNSTAEAGRLCLQLGETDSGPTAARDCGNPAEASVLPLAPVCASCPHTRAGMRERTTLQHWLHPNAYTVAPAWRMGLLPPMVPESVAARAGLLSSTLLPPRMRMLRL